MKDEDEGTETRRQGDTETGRVTASPRRLVSPSPRLRVSSLILKKRGGHEDHPYQVSSERFLVSG